MTYSVEDFEREYGKLGSWKRFWHFGVPSAFILGTIIGLVLRIAG